MKAGRAIIISQWGEHIDRRGVSPTYLDEFLTLIVSQLNPVRSDDKFDGKLMAWIGKMDADASIHMLSDINYFKTLTFECFESPHVLVQLLR